MSDFDFSISKEQDKNEYTVDSPAYPRWLIDDLLDSYGADNRQTFLDDAQVMLMTLDMRLLYRYLTRDDDSAEGKEAKRLMNEYDETFYAAGGSNGHSGFSWFTLLRIVWMLHKNGMKPEQFAS